VSDECRYFLARRSEPMEVELVDGCHSSPEGVAKAAKLLGRIFRDEGPWIMVELHPMPDLDPPINEDAARDCAYLIDEFGPGTRAEHRSQDTGGGELS
jgi:hypothetical protein